MPKIAIIPERTIQAQEAVLTGFEIGMQGRAHLYFSAFNSDILLSEDQQERILAIILESAATDENLRDATIEDRVSPVVAEGGAIEAITP